MTTPRSQRSDPRDRSSSPSRRNLDTPLPDAAAYDDGPANSPNPTFATFSPTTLASATPSATSAAKRRSTVLVHQKSPLLLATPPQITRALAYSHPFLLPLNNLAGLLSWTTGDPWESFVLVCIWWALVLYGDVAIRVAGPVVLVLTLIAGMYGRRYSPLSTSGWSEPGSAKDSSSTDTQAPANQGKSKAKGYTKNMGMSADSAAASSTAKSNGNAAGGGGPGHQRNVSSVEATSTRHQKTLDEIVETLKEFTSRCNILIEPLLELTDFLSTQISPTSATTRPALTALLIRILLCTPFWFALTLPPWQIVTTRRVALVFGTFILTWHSRVMRVSRTIMWRSVTVRKVMGLVTGLAFDLPTKPIAGETFPAAGAPPLSAEVLATQKATGRNAVTQESELTKAIRRAKGGNDAGVRFTFIIYENQRRWVGLGWTSSLFAYERTAWTDEHNNAVPPRDQFELPEVEDESNMRWRWVQGSRWRVDGVPDDAVKVVKATDNGEEVEWDYDSDAGRMGWVFYDNKWQNGRRGQDGWGRWTRRRKWYRDAELVEVSDQSEEHTPTPTQSALPAPPALPPRPRSPSGSSLHARSISNASRVSMMDEAARSMPDIAEHDDPDHRHTGEDEDAVSLMSSSPRSVRNSYKGGLSGPPSLRRRITDSSRTSGGGGKRSRRASEATSEDDASLGMRLGLELQGAGKEGWGIGDEARMGLE